MLINRGFWPLTFALLIGCSGEPGSSGKDTVVDTVNTDSVGGDDDDDTIPANVGYAVVNGLIDGQPEDCQVTDCVSNLYDQVETGTPIPLEAGTYPFGVGDENVTDLNRTPLHENDGSYWLGQCVEKEVKAHETTTVDVDLAPAPKYVCESFDCAFPYDGGTCPVRLDDETQWIVLEGDNLVGENGNGFAGQGTDDDVYTLVNNTLTLVESPIPDLTMIEGSFDPATLKFSYKLTSDAAGATVYVVCSPE